MEVLKGLIRDRKDGYRQRMENQLQQRNISRVWRGLRTVSGLKKQLSACEGCEVTNQLKQVVASTICCSHTHPHTHLSFILDTRGAHCTSAPTTTSSIQSFCSSLPLSTT